MKILIADDETLARTRLKSLCDANNDIHVVGEAAHGQQVLEMVQQHLPDIVLLDIRMPGMDGLETAQHLSHLEAPPAVIFTTAYDQYALAAFESHAVDYLLKPIRKERLFAALDSVTRLTRAQLEALNNENPTQSQRTHISARMQGNLELIAITNIRYFQADQKYVAVGYIACNKAERTSSEVLIEESLKSLEADLGDRFVRVHRNALVAIDYVISLEKDSQGSHWLGLQDSDHKLEISRRHLPMVRKIIKQKSS